MKVQLPRKKTIDVSRGRVAYLEAGAGAGQGPPVLFLHGIPTSGLLWRQVMDLLGGRLRCIAPDLMGLGDTVVDPETTDFSMPSQVEMLLELLDALGIARAHVVAHDQGGAAAQILAVHHPNRVDRLVLTNCVCYDNWPVPAVRRLQILARLPGHDLAARLGLIEAIERSPLSAFRRGFADPDRLDLGIVSEYLRPLRGSRAERERFRRFLLAGSPRYTMDVAAALRELECPTLVLWAAQDYYLPPTWARRLHRDIPGAEIEVVAGAGHFWPEEAPGPFAARIGEFLTAPIEGTGRRPLRVVPADGPRKCAMKEVRS